MFSSGTPRNAWATSGDQSLANLMQVGGKAVEDEVRQSLEDYIEQRTKQWSLGRTGGRSHVKDEIDTHGVQGVTFASPLFHASDCEGLVYCVVLGLSLLICDLFG